MSADREVNFSATDPTMPDQPVWHAFRSEVRSSDLRWSDLKQLAERRLIGPHDYIWYPSWDSWRPAGHVDGLFQPPDELRSERVRARATQPKNLKDRARHELQSYLMITAYIWAIISLLRLHQALLADTYNFSYESQGRAIIIALVLGKVVLIAEALRLGDVLGNRLPALAIAIRAMLFATAILAFHACEEVAISLWHGGSLDTIAGDLSAHTIRRSGLLALIMTIALIPYFLIKEIERRTGQSHLLLLAVGLKR